MKTIHLLLLALLISHLPNGCAKQTVEKQKPVGRGRIVCELSPKTHDIDKIMNDMMNTMEGSAYFDTDRSLIIKKDAATYLISLTVTEKAAGLENFQMDMSGLATQMSSFIFNDNPTIVFTHWVDSSNVRHEFMHRSIQNGQVAISARRLRTYFE